MAMNLLFGVALLSGATTNGSSAIPKTANGKTTVCKLLFERNIESSKSLKSSAQDLVVLNLAWEICLTRSDLLNLASSAAGNCCWLSMSQTKKAASWELAASTQETTVTVAPTSESTMKMKNSTTYTAEASASNVGASTSDTLTILDGMPLATTSASEVMVCSVWVSATLKMTRRATEALNTRLMELQRSINMATDD